MEAVKAFIAGCVFVNVLIIAFSYWLFCCKHFSGAGKQLDRSVVEALYGRFDGITFYLQKVMNVLYMRTKEGDACKVDDVQPAIDYIVDFTGPTYEDLMYQLPEKQALVLRAVARIGKADHITSGKFVKKNGLVSPSAVKSAVNALMDKDLITQNKGIYEVYDKFLEIWLNRV